MSGTLDNTTSATTNYAERNRREKGESHSSAQTHPRSSSEAGRELKVNTSSILATAGSAAGGAFLVGSLSGPIGAVGGAVIGVALGIYLQKSKKK